MFSSCSGENSFLRSGLSKYNRQVTSVVNRRKNKKDHRFHSKIEVPITELPITFSSQEMKTMDYSILNHIQGKNGSRWAEFIRETGTENLLMVAIDAAKYTQKAMIATFYGDILVKPLSLMLQRQD